MSDMDLVWFVLLVLFVFNVLHSGNTASTRTISWSMGKSLVSAAIGICLDKNLLSLHDKVDALVPQLKGSGYEGVTIRDVLQMRLVLMKF